GRRRSRGTRVRGFALRGALGAAGRLGARGALLRGGAGGGRAGGARGGGALLLLRLGGWALLGALGDDLGDGLGGDLLGLQLRLGHLAVHDGVGEDLLLGAGLALGGGLGGALVERVVLDRLGLERDVLGLGAFLLADALDRVGRAVLEEGVAGDVGGVAVLDVAEDLLHRLAHGEGDDL